MDEVTTLKDRVLERLDALGVGAVEAATRAGLERNFIRDIVEKGKQSVRSSNMEKLATALGTTPEWLTGRSDRAATKPDAQLDPPNASPPVPVQYPTARLPMLGTAVGGEDGRFVLNGNQIGDALCPPQLLGVPNAYGVFVNGTSMEPRYHPGEAVFVNPHLPVRSGDYVVVQVAGAFDGDDIAGYVKRFVSMNAKELVLEQYQDRDPAEAGALPGDARTIRIARPRVVAVHKIVASGIA